MATYMAGQNRIDGTTRHDGVPFETFISPFEIDCGTTGRLWRWLSVIGGRRWLLNQAARERRTSRQGTTGRPRDRSRRPKACWSREVVKTDAKGPWPANGAYRARLYGNSRERTVSGSSSLAILDSATKFRRSTRIGWARFFLQVRPRFSLSANVMHQLIEHRNVVNERALILSGDQFEKLAPVLE